MRSAIKVAAFDRLTGKQVGKARTEIVDTDRNKIFQQCQDMLDVHDAYESFWNHLPTRRPSEVVFVQNIKYQQKLNRVK